MNADVDEQIGETHTLMVLSQLPVARMPACGASTHFTTLTGASCCATCVACPVVMSNARPALSTPPENTLLPSYEELLYTGITHAPIRGAYLIPADAEHRPWMMMNDLALRLSEGTNLINPYLSNRMSAWQVAQ
jgi:hypothetical protein